MIVRPAPCWKPDAGWHHEPMVDSEWVVPPIGAGRCRGSIGAHRACGRPAVATLRRGRTGAPWDYCEQHLYGRWIENGKVMAWRVVRDEVGG